MSAQSLRELIQTVPRTERLGRLQRMVGLVAESDGPPAKIGDLCLVDAHDRVIPCEAVGFRGRSLLLMPLCRAEGLQSGALVRCTGKAPAVPVGDGLLGRVVDALGDPMDGGPALDAEPRRSIEAQPPNALRRKTISERFETGVRALDGCLTFGKGQRVGIFSGSGVGKSTLLGMIARNGEADVNVIALIGERGREVREFIQNDLGEEGLAKSVVVCATSDAPALLRIKAAMTATTIAESFRDQGKDVLLLMDSVTRFAMAQREVGLAIGEPPSSKGYTPSVFSLLPKLLERTGCGPSGAITAVYSVLVEGDDTNEPVADAVRSILDGHVVLDRSLAQRAHYPPISIAHSLSRVMPMVTDNEHRAAVNDLREMMTAHDDVRDLISVGAYVEGKNPKADLAIAKSEEINDFLRQRADERTSFEDSIQRIKEMTDAEIQVPAAKAA